MSEESAEHYPRLLFHRGMRAILGNWSAMKLLVQEGWSSKHPLEGLQELEDELLINFEENWDEGKQVPAADVEEFLQQFVVEEFFMDVQDDSFGEVARLLTRMYDECRTGRTADVIKFLDAREATTAKFLGLPPPAGGDRARPAPAADDAAPSATLEQEGGTPDEGPAPGEPDADGWVTEAPKSKKKKRKGKGGLPGHLSGAPRDGADGGGNGGEGGSADAGDAAAEL